MSKILFGLLELILRLFGWKRLDVKDVARDLGIARPPTKTPPGDPD